MTHSFDQPSPHPVGQYPPHQYPQGADTRTNALAIAGFVLAFVVSIAGVVLGFVALAQIRRTGERGRGLAVAAVAVGFFFIIFVTIGILAAVAIPVFLGQQNQARDAAVEADVSNAKIVVIEWETEHPGARPTMADLAEGGFEESPGTEAAALASWAGDGTFCFQESSSGDGLATFHADQDSDVTAGPCP